MDTTLSGIAKDMTLGVYDASDATEMNDVFFTMGKNYFMKQMGGKVDMTSTEVFNALRDIIGVEGGQVKFTWNHGAVNIWNDVVFATISYDFSIDKVGLGKINTNHTSIVAEGSYYGRRGGENGEYTVKVKSGDLSEINRIIDGMVEVMKTRRVNSIVWAFQTSNGTYRKQIFIEKQKPLTKDLYPWIGDDTVQEYFDRYLKSNESILLLTGVPGTGKTTFIRNLISENRLNAEITYDEKLISGDEFYLHFINDEDLDVLVIEDADHLIFDREKNDNALLNKLLNISDGLVKNVAKKIIFSTNITNLESIDPALIRPGRCFDVLDFRKLTHDEATEVVKNHDLSIELREREYTLAELFSSNNRLQNTQKFKVGF